MWQKLRAISVSVCTSETRSHTKLRTRINVLWKDSGLSRVSLWNNFRTAGMKVLGVGSIWGSIHKVCHQLLLPRRVLNFIIKWFLQTNIFHVTSINFPLWLIIRINPAWHWSSNCIHELFPSSYRSIKSIESNDSLFHYYSSWIKFRDLYSDPVVDLTWFA